MNRKYCNFYVHVHNIREQFFPITEIKSTSRLTIVCSSNTLEYTSYFV